MAEKKVLSASDIVESHKPKTFKFKYYFKDDEFLKLLYDEGYDLDSLDTIRNDELTNAAYNDTEFDLYDRTIIKRANEPTILEDGIILSKKMVTKADKKLKSIGVGFFNHNKNEYIVIKLVYEKFDIIEIFVLC